MALVLMVLLSEEQRNAEFLKVREEFERLVFPMPKEEGLTLLLEVQNAMKRLDQLVTPEEEQRELSWAKGWFEDIGVDVSNPVDLCLFASGWMDQFVTVTSILRQFKPA